LELGFGTGTRFSAFFNESEPKEESGSQFFKNWHQLGEFWKKIVFERKD